MSKQIRISDETHRLLKVESDREGKTLDKFLMDILEDVHMTEYGVNQQKVRAHLDECRPDDKIWVIYSAFSRDEKKYHEIKSVVCTGKYKFIARRHKESYESAIVENPTWLDICVLANDMILKTGDMHHRYLEGLNIAKPADGKDDFSEVEFSMGS